VTPARGGRRWRTLLWLGAVGVLVGSGCSSDEPPVDEGGLAFRVELSDPDDLG
jgi:hypothetical protein